MTESELQELLKKLLEESESEFVEFKLSQKVDFGQYVSALSNGACLRNEDFGYLVFGVDDKNRKVVGTNVKRGDLERVSIKKSLSPKIDYSTHNFQYQNKSIVLVKISAAKGEPTLYRGQGYARIGEDKTSLQNVTTDQVKKIYNSTTDWSAEIVESATINDLDADAVKKAKEKFKEKSENRRYLQDVDGWSNETFLDKVEVTIEGKITNCALILLGKRESRKLLKYSNASEITWELKSEGNIRPVYERFYPPFLVSVEDVWGRIRNTKYLHPSNQMLNIEVPKYDNETIIEALNNSIAHQYYFSNDRGVTIIENQDSLIFQNYGNFFSGNPEDYALGKAKAQKYRNQLLVSAMINLGMIDKMGTGISRMYQSQRKRFFPMPDYSKSTSEEVVLEIYGKVIDERFSQILMEQDLDLTTTILLDHVQKNLPITEDGAKLLKKQKLIEGRKPKYFIASEVALAADQKGEYIKNKAFNDRYYKDLILKYLAKYQEATRDNIENLLMEKLSEILTQKQKKLKISNLLNLMRIGGEIKNYGSNRKPVWKIK